MKKHIVILATGGTIAGRAATATQTTNYESAVLSVAQLIQDIPELADIATITSEQLAQLDSVDMSHSLWLTLADRINQLLALPDIDGVVVTHGTDTLEETAYFLNLVTRSQKPVVMVGALRPANAMSTDGPMNLYQAVALAASAEAHDKGVLVCLNDTINCSRDVTKTNTSLQDAFKAPELGYLGYIQAGKPHFYRIPARKHSFHSEFFLTCITSLPVVAVLYGHVNSDPLLAEAAVSAGAKGLVYAGLGNGGMSTAMKIVLTQLASQGIVVVRSTRVTSGIVTRNGALDDDACNFVAADTLSPQKASILLMLALTKTSNPAEIQQMFWEY
jgi:L-asparaginase